MDGRSLSNNGTILAQSFLGIVMYLRRLSILILESYMKELITITKLNFPTPECSDRKASVSQGSLLLQ
jgi:hypothetical protein